MLSWGESWVEDLFNGLAIYEANGRPPRLDDLKAIQRRLRSACVKLAQEIAARHVEMQAYIAETDEGECPWEGLEDEPAVDLHSFRSEE